MNPAYAKKLGLLVRKTDVGAQKIDGSRLETFGMELAGFSLQDKLGMVRFSQETFLLVVLGMPFLTLGSADQTYKGFQRGSSSGGFTRLQKHCRRPSGWNSSVRRNLRRRP